MREIPVYLAEQRDGLISKINDPTYSHIAFASQLCVSEDNIVDDERTSLLKKIQADANDQIDLYPIKSILVTTGWNKNDDVFIPQTTWAARHTPEDKPFNLEHDPSVIIGHITHCSVIDDDNNVVNDMCMVDELPSKFHILTSAVIYKHLASKRPEMEEMSREIIEGIQNGDWFVSMEALFSDFDYAIMGNNTQQLVARNQDTAFLTKHLRAYGGTGVYDNCKLGRVPRHIVFSGKGLVKKPANPESLIFDDSVMFAGSLATKITEFTKKEESINMAADNSVDNSALQATVADLETRLKQMDEEKVQAKYDAFEATIASQRDNLKLSEEKIAELEEKLNSIGASEEASKTEVEDLKTKLTEADDKLKVAEEELTQMKANIQLEKRTSDLVDKGVDKAQAEEITKKFADSTDEQFEAIVKMHADLVEARNASSSEQETVEGSEDGDEEVDSAEANADEDALEDAEDDTEATLASEADSTDESKELVSALASFLDQKLNPSEDN